MDIPENCKHRGSFKKDCCELIWNGTIVEHDGCVAKGGCDLVVYNNKRIFFIEIKGGNISSKDASRTVKQIESCEKCYSHVIGHRKKSNLLVWCVNGKKKRLDGYARKKLKNAKIRIIDCRKSLELETF